MADEFCLKMPDFHVTFRGILHAVKLRHGTNGFTSLPKEGVLRIFFALKNPTASAGFEPANLGAGTVTAVQQLGFSAAVSPVWGERRTLHFY